MIDYERDYARIDELVRDRISLMEVCGSHTTAISRFGLRSRLPDRLRLISGPGCPVCVSPTCYIDTLIELSLLPQVTLTTFGDLIRVPGSSISLQAARSQGAMIKVVYSPLEALDYAIEHPESQIVFASVGFETTLPGTAATILQAEKKHVTNFSILSAGRLALPAMNALLETGEVKIDGFICPGHVSIITGSNAYKPLVERYNVPCVITGFEAHDLLKGIIMLLEQITSHRAEVESEYSRAVTPEGNRQAKHLMDEVFEVIDAEWRGIGMIPQSGVKLQRRFSSYDAANRFELRSSKDYSLPAGCSCGEIMRGVLLPNECALYGTTCSPSFPVGPCMVSSEGACAAYYNYGIKVNGYQ